MGPGFLEKKEKGKLWANAMKRIYTDPTHCSNLRFALYSVPLPHDVKLNMDEETDEFDSEVRILR